MNVNECCGRLVVGLIEKIKFDDSEGIHLAKVDTGADSSSIDEEIFKSLQGNNKIVAHKYVRSALGRSKRPIVILNIEFQGKKFNESFTVSNRKNLKYKVLIGKDILQKEGFMVDPLKNNVGDLDQIQSPIIEGD